MCTSDGPAGLARRPGPRAVNIRPMRGGFVPATGRCKRDLVGGCFLPRGGANARSIRTCERDLPLFAPNSFFPMSLTAPTLPLTVSHLRRNCGICDCCAAVATFNRAALDTRPGKRRRPRSPKRLRLRDPPASFAKPHARDTCPGNPSLQAAPLQPPPRGFTVLPWPP